MCGLEVIELVLKLAIFTSVFSGTKRKDNYINLAYYFILFNPFSMANGYSHANVGVFNNVLFYLFIWMSIHGLRYASSTIILDILSVVLIYFDIRLIFVMIILTLL